MFIVLYKEIHFLIESLSKKIVFMAKICIFFIILKSMHAENWHGYYYGNTQIGYAKSSYKYQRENRVYHYKRTKIFILQGQKSSEEISAVLNNDYTLRSLYLNQKNGTKDEFIIINVGNEITVQASGKVYTFPLKKFYLHLGDFLRSLTKRSLESKKYYRSVVLSSDRLRLVRTTAQYIGTRLDEKKRKVYQFKITSDELKNHWAHTHVTQKGIITKHEISGLLVLQVSQKNALSFLKGSLNITVPYIQDIDHIRKLYIVNTLPFSQNLYQKREGKYLVLQSIFPTKSFSLSQITKRQFFYLQKTKEYPVANNYIREYSSLARYGAKKPATIVRNIARWVSVQMSASQNQYRSLLQELWGMRKETDLFATITMCRISGIPARMAKGWVLHRGFFSYNAWAEVYLGRWVPVYQGKIDNAARFLKTDITANVQLRIEKMVTSQKNITIYGKQNYLKYDGKKFRDELLGLEATRPDDWAFLPKNIFSNVLILRSLKGTGPAIFLKVLRSSKKLEEILQDIPQKILQQNIQILWSQKRTFQNIQGLEGALKSQKYIYRVFVGQKKDKIVLVLLLAPQSEFKAIESEFFSFVSSLKFIY